MANTNEEYILDQLVIHGNRRRALQFGYTNPKDMTTIDPDEIAILKRYLGDAFMDGGGHYFGNPAFCMHLKISDFFRQADGTIGCTIQEAWLDKFPYKPWSEIDGYGYKTAGTYPGYNPPLGPWDLPYEHHPWDTQSRYPIWTLKFTISAGIYAGSKMLSNSVLFTRNDYAHGGSNSTWPNGCANPNNYPTMGGHMSKPVRLAGRVTNADDPIILVIYNRSNCYCGQANKNRPVFATDISPYIPKIKPYVWRRFGTSAAEKAIAEAQFGDRSKADGNWHLVRPFFVRGNQGWHSVEEGSE